MTSPKDCTAAELADRLDYLSLCEPNTGFASMLDEATIAFDRKSNDVAVAHLRSTHKRSYSPATGDYSRDAWPALAAAARGLAKALRPLGDMRIARCPECTVPLHDDGVCHFFLCPTAAKV